MVMQQKPSFSPPPVPPYNLTIEATPDERVEYLSDVNLTCSAVGGPTLNYTWSSPLGDDTSGSVLQIVGATEPDEGVYTCTVISDNAPVEQVSITLTSVCVCVCTLLCDLLYNQSSNSYVCAST